jgi:membrane-bound lytic murein transglycosylase D
MRKIAYLIITVLFLHTLAQAQHKVVVPDQIRFADMRLNLTPEAQKKIQTDVDALTRYEKYFNAKVKKVNAYLPLIEQVLREENVPDDIKYLVIQESALVGDAVSSSNAVGYWQFKEATGREVGLTISGAVDERMNIITATRGAARYFKNNNTYFDNWLYALLAYYAGPGGALKIADKKYYGKREMKLNGRTHWYVLKYLAHKLAFEPAVGKNLRPEKVLFAYTRGNGKTLAQVAREFGLEETELERHNRWVRQKRIPDDKRYYVIIPEYADRTEQPLLVETPNPPHISREPRSIDQSATYKQQQERYVEVDDTTPYPVIRQANRWGKEVTLVNNIRGVIVQEGENIRAISQRTGVNPSQLVEINNLSNRNAAVIPGEPLYLRKKRNKGPVHYHVAEPDETMWSISQRFGIKLKKLVRNNRMSRDESVQAGRVMWLRFIRPPHIPVEYRNMPEKELKKQFTASTTYNSLPKQENISPSPVVPDTDRRDLEPEPQVQEVPEESNSSTAREPELPASEPSAPVVSHSGPSVADNSIQEEEVLIPVIDRQDNSAAPAESHTVQPGETLYGIARQYDLTIPQLTSYNNIDWEVPLSVGQRLRLIPPEEAAGTKTKNSLSAEDHLYHEVQFGETLYGIARQYDVTIKDLMRWNGKDDFNVDTGERLKIVNK